ncbi:MAG: DUF697 domain-containing protein [Candidatus Eisenbacteria bacterium]|nr:DUF697 domain-containing protein [Candidatus Eisenbacteria bacterium]
MRALRKILIPVGVGLTILALVTVLGSALVVYREASGVHPFLGIAVIVALAAGVGLLIVYPVTRLLMLPVSLIRPEARSGRKWERYLRRYAERLLRNERVRRRYDARVELAQALEAAGGKRGMPAPGDGEPAAPLARLEKQITAAIHFLDGEARDVAARHAAAVFAATAVSQSGRLDTAIVLSAQLRLVREVAEVYFQRPHPRELWGLYLNVGTSAFIAGEIQDSEVLAVLGAPVSAGLSGFIPLRGMDPLVSLLVGSLLDGSANALLTLRIGALARRYCGLRPDPSRRALARSASLEAAGMLAGVVSQGASRVASATRRLVVGGAVRGTQRAALGVVGAGGNMMGGLARLVGKAAGDAAKKVSQSPTAVLRQMADFWENVEAVFGTREDHGPDTRDSWQGPSVGG